MAMIQTSSKLFFDRGDREPRPESPQQSEGGARRFFVCSNSNFRRAFYLALVLLLEVREIGAQASRISRTRTMKLLPR
jgi:hypothetical protein